MEQATYTEKMLGSSKIRRYNWLARGVITCMPHSERKEEKEKKVNYAAEMSAQRPAVYVPSNL